MNNRKSIVTLGIFLILLIVALIFVGIDVVGEQKHNIANSIVIIVAVLWCIECVWLGAIK